ncbi:rhomboid family intramembrane serine protease [Candidatus Bathyarchaeota archaeon]|nr:MAG: rhomboid family intramembrane serine protease [Candidatus Bathyarchaeota archaeon]
MRVLNLRWGPTHIIIAANIIIYIVTSVAGGNFIQTEFSPMYIYLAQFNYLIQNFGWQTVNGVSLPCPALWQLFTSMFVHANLVHIFGNMFFLLIFGYRAEVLFRSREYYFIYFASGLFGNVLSLFLMPDYTISVGASGAIFGVFGASVIFIRRAIGQSIIGALIYAFFLFMMNVGPGVNIFAHLGGLVAGLLIGYWLAKRRMRIVHTYSYSFSVNH